MNVEKSSAAASPMSRATGSLRLESVTHSARRIQAAIEDTGNLATSSAPAIAAPERHVPSHQVMPPLTGGADPLPTCRSDFMALAISREATALTAHAKTLVALLRHPERYAKLNEITFLSAHDAELYALANLLVLRMGPPVHFMLDHQCNAQVSAAGLMCLSNSSCQSLTLINRPVSELDAMSLAHSNGFIALRLQDNADLRYAVTIPMLAYLRAPKSHLTFSCALPLAKNALIQLLDVGSADVNAIRQLLLVQSLKILALGAPLRGRNQESAAQTIAACGSLAALTYHAGAPNCICLLAMSPTLLSVELTLFAAAEIRHLAGMPALLKVIISIVPQTPASSSGVTPNAALITLADLGELTRKPLRSLWFRNTEFTQDALQLAVTANASKLWIWTQTLFEDPILVALTDNALPFQIGVNGQVQNAGLLTRSGASTRVYISRDLHKTRDIDHLWIATDAAQVQSKGQAEAL